MDMTIKVNLLDPNARDALRALLAVLDQKDEAAPKGKPAEPAAAPPAAAEPATPPAEGDGGEAVLTAAQRDEVIKLQTERVQDVDEARSLLKNTLQACFQVNSLSALRQKWLPDVLEYAKTGAAPDTVPF